MPKKTISFEEDELRKHEDEIKERAEERGFMKAEELLNRILEGNRMIFIGGPFNINGEVQAESIYDEKHKDSPWAKLSRRLDE